MSYNQLISLAGWYFLPDLITNYAQTTLYAIFIRAGDPKPTPGSARFTRDRRHVRMAVIVLYLLYTIYEADHGLSQAGDFYRVLDVPHDATEKAIQSKFRRLTVQYHPDKVAEAGKAAAEATYVRLQRAKDTLTEPARRFAYDRFGPQVLDWQDCTQVKDFIVAGLMNVAVYYAVSAAVFVVLGVLGYAGDRGGVFWRYYILAALFVAETYIATRPHWPVALTRVLNPVVSVAGWHPPYLPFQAVELLRKLSLTFFVAVNQLGPLLRNPREEAAHAGQGVSDRQLDFLEQMARTTNVEVTRLVDLELTPFAMNPESSKELRAVLKEWLVQNTVRNDPEVKRAIEGVLDRRRREAQGEEGVKI
jgi:hypothetical protein